MRYINGRALFVAITATLCLLALIIGAKLGGHL